MNQEDIVIGQQVAHTFENSERGSAPSYKYDFSDPTEPPKPLEQENEKGNKKDGQKSQIVDVPL